MRQRALKLYLFLGKRKANDIAQAILESREIAEREKERRYKEKMEIKLLEKLDKILDKI